MNIDKEDILQELRITMLNRLLLAIIGTPILLIVFAQHSTMVLIDWFMPILTFAVLTILRIRGFKIVEQFIWESLLVLLIPLIVHVHFRYGGNAYAEGGVILIAIACTIFVDSKRKQSITWALCLIAFTIFQVSRYLPEFRPEDHLNDAQGAVFILFYISCILIILITYLNAQKDLKARLASPKKNNAPRPHPKNSLSTDTTEIFHRIGHDLRGPSQNIANMGRKISHLISSNDYDRLKALSAEFEASGSAMNYTVENVLNWANSKVIKQQGPALQIDINNTIQTILYKLKSLIQSKALRFEIKVPENFQIKTDPRLFEIICYNLMHNAATYSDQNGIITIASRTTAHDCTIQIHNQGKTIDPATLALIDNRDFTVIQTIRNGQETSYGLGLETCFNLAKAIGVDISISSTSIKGTLVLINLNLDGQDG